MKELKFGKDFIFGAATAAYQIEGAVNEGNRGPSIWDRFSHRKGKILNNHNGDIACDHYHRYPEDVALMRELGLTAYRFSLSWSRILPEGTGRVNAEGIDFYRRLADKLLEAGITPYATLFHWDMPLQLHRRYGGFLNRQAALDFAEYAAVVADALGDRIKHWITMNEPWEHSCLGHVIGVHAPGHRRPWTHMNVIHNQLLAHGLALEKIRQRRPDAQVGITLSLTPIHPHSDRDKDHLAAGIGNEFMNFITLDPLLKGHYPEDLCRRFGRFAPKIEPGDMTLISAANDFIGVNNYQREFARYTRLVPFLNTWIVGGTGVADGDFIKDGVQHTAMGWEVHPPAIYEVLKWLQDKYDNPRVLITENGAAFDDNLVEGRVNDPKRIAYLHAYLAQVKKAIDEGARIEGYFVWTLMDNFEWAVGYAKRFGLIHIDYATQQRTIKDSGYWYRDLIRLNQQMD
ncbi:beta-glucosidase [Exilibacterium tricleocarpae]|uniref:Beta-glucosidase n=1 Tax=Exilibacterium tricleocarpae TaxID=2591008 RepID=A0A545SQK0_9GAMM|nr:GH1 family beta-glucosidase [Exilibacterium tricleocarpae]TQV67237.1 beta-glucosidase [Exilibacterium tricleocarpae]